MFMLSPGTSMVRMPMPSLRISRRKVFSTHHSTSSTMATPSPPAAQAVLSPIPTPAPQFVQGLGDHARARWRSRVTKGQRAAEHVELLHVHLAGWLIPAQLVTGKSGAGKHLEVRQRLGSKGFVHVDEGQIPRGDAGTVQRQRRGIEGPSACPASTSMAENAKLRM